MKILAVRGKNLASLHGHFEVDFRTPPLDRAGLVAITGPTGAGKTTLLDAICLALFDRTPRFANRGGVTIGGAPGGAPGEGGLRANDVRGILRHGAVDGWAEVDFLGVDDRVWTARWEVRRARGRHDGRIQAQQMKLSDAVTGRAVEADRKLDVLEAIEARLGLDFDQFRRSVLLAQGEFAAFLEASGSDRAELLERMTGTRLYRELGRAAFERAKQADAELDLLRRELDGLDCLDEAARTQLKAQVEALTQARAELTRARAQAEADRTWHARLGELERGAARAKAGVEDAREALRALDGDARTLGWIEAALPWRERAAERGEWAREADERDEERRFITGELGGMVEQRARLVREGAAREEALTRARERRARLAPALERARELDTRAAALAEEREAAERARVGLEAARVRDAAKLEQVEASVALARAGVDERRTWLAARPGLARLADGWGHYKMLLHQQLRDLGRRAEGRHRQAVLEPRLRDLAVETEEARAEFEVARKERSSARRALKKVDRDIDAEPPLATLRLRRRALDEARERWTALSRVQERHHRSEQATERLEAERRDLELERDHRARASREAAEALGAVELLFDEAQRALRQLEAVRDLASHRADLRPGEPCPLCGAEEHPAAVHAAPVDEAIAGQRARVLTLSRQRDDLRRTQAEHDSRAQVAREALNRLAAELEEQTRERAEAREEWAELRAPGPLLPAEDTDPSDDEGLGEVAAQVAAKEAGQLSLLGAAAPVDGRERALVIPRKVAGSKVATALWAMEDALSRRLRQLNAAQRRVDELLGEQQLRKQRRDRAEDGYEKGRDELQAAERAQTEAERELRELGASLESLDADLDERATELADGLDAALRELQADGAELGLGLGDAPLEGEGALAGALDRVVAELESDEGRAGVGEAFVAALGRACEDYRSRAARLEREREGLATLETSRAELVSKVAARAEACEAATGQLATLDARATELRQARTALDELGGRAVGELSRELEAELSKAQRERDDARERLAKLELDLQGRQTRLRSVEEQLRSTRRRLESLDAELVQLRMRAAERAGVSLEQLDAELAGLEAQPELWTPRWREGKQAALSQARARVERSVAVAEERARVAAAHREDLEQGGEGEGRARLDADQARARLEQLDADARRLDGELFEAELRIRRDAQARERAAALGPRLRGAERDVRVWGRLREVIGSATGDKFQKFAQSLTLELLLVQANAQLRDLKPRYSLGRVPRHDLELQLVDHDLGDEVRSIRGLSGGEKFLVSLALALALASLSANDCRIDSLFIDEGFGTLDAQSLDIAVSTLDALQAEGRQIGIISHVPGLAERVGVEIQVRPQASGRSSVRVVGPS